MLGSWLLAAPRRWAMRGLRLHGLASLWWLKVICGTRVEVRGREKLPDGRLPGRLQASVGLGHLRPHPGVPRSGHGHEGRARLIPLYGWFSHKFQHIFVKRDKGPSALKAMIRDARQRAAQGREIVIFPEGTRRPPGAPPDYKPGYLALYEGLGLPCVPLALNSGLFWPRRSLMRYPGTIVIEILDPVPAGLPRAEARQLIQSRIEAACERLIAEARAQAQSAAAAGSCNRSAPAATADTK